MLRKAPGIKVEVFDKLGSLMLMAFNFYHPPFDNVKLRRAVMSAINQQELVNSVGGEQQNLGRVRRRRVPARLPLFHHRGDIIASALVRSVQRCPCCQKISFKTQ